MFKEIMLLSFPLNWVKNHLMNLPASSSISYGWNFGSLMGMVFVFQVFSGVVLSFNFVSEGSMAFDSVIFMTRENFYGFLFRWVHLNGASLFFLSVYFHIFRGLIFSSFRLFLPWVSGTIILIVLMMIAFLGYVLPWGQMSLWGATVITNLLSTIPFIGPDLVIWIWGGFSVGTPTLGLFYSFHFLFPLVLVYLIMFHMIVLHESGSSSSLGMLSSESKYKFHPSYSFKDMINLSVFLIFFLFVFLFPFKLGDPENFSMANSLSSPLHIQPEWYFLFAYAILRAIPNKLGGVIGLVLSVFIFCIFPFFSKSNQIFMKIKKNMCFFFFFFWFILTWVGGNPVEKPYIFISFLFTFFYFFLLFIIIILWGSMKFCP